MYIGMVGCFWVPGIDIKKGSLGLAGRGEDVLASLCDGLWDCSEDAHIIGEHVER